MSKRIGEGHLQSWAANGLQELQSAVSLGDVQVQPGNNPGLFGTILPQEAMEMRSQEAAVQPAAPIVEADKQEPEMEM